jgi:hypothetical protein
MTGEQPSPAAVDQRLHWAAAYLHEPHWCERTARQLGFASVDFVKDKINPYFPVHLAVRGEPATLEAAALVSVIRRALIFRRFDRLMLDLTGGRLSITLGDMAYAQVHGISMESREPISTRTLQQLEELGLPLASVLYETSDITA